MPFLNDYTLLLEVGKGGFATVYKVRHNKLGYVRAIRVLNEMIPHEESELWKKFLEECCILLRLGNGNHPNIVHIYQPRLIQNKAFIEMDYVDGDNLSTFVREQHHFLPVEEVLKMAQQISSALKYCHEDIYKFCMDRAEDHLQDDPEDGRKVLLDDATRHRLIEKYKVIHNDIHSGNIIRRENGDYVLLDFGLAITGSVVVRTSRRKNGAPEFKPPEKWDNESLLTEQSDIYSFGVVLYEMLAGHVPFALDPKLPDYKAEGALAEAHKTRPVDSVLPLRKQAFEATHPGQAYQKDYPDWLEALIMKCLAKNPADRFMNGRELYEAVMAGVKQTNEYRVSTLQAKCTRLQNEVNEQEQQRASLQSELLLQEQEKADLQKELKQLKQSLKPMTVSPPSQSAELKEKVSQLEKENSRVQSERDRLQEERDQLKQSSEKSAGLKEKISQLEKENSRVQSERADLQKKLEQLKQSSEKSAELKEKESQLKKENSRLQSEQTQLQGRVKELESALKKGKPGSGKWKVFALLLLLATLVCAGGWGYGLLKGSTSNTDNQKPQHALTNVDSLLKVNDTLNRKIDSLEKEVGSITSERDEWEDLFNQAVKECDKLNQ